MNRLNWKRIYEEPEKNDGFRVFVDRLWARGIKKDVIERDDYKNENSFFTSKYGGKTFQ